MNKTNLLYVVILFTLLVTGCKSNSEIVDGTEFATTSEMYDIDNSKEKSKSNNIVEYIVYKDEYIVNLDNNTSISVDYVQISNLGNVNLENQINQINQILKSSLSEWVNEECEWFEQFEVDIKYKSPEYLSVCYTAHWENPNGNDFIGTVTRIGITIDINEGKRVYLNDFFEEAVVINRFLEEYNYGTEFSAPIREEEAKEIIHEASISVKEYLDEKQQTYPLVYEFMLSYISEKSSFYLEGNKIIITRDEYEMSDVYLEYKWL